MDRYCPLKINSLPSAVRLYAAVGSIQLLKIVLLHPPACSGLWEGLTPPPYKHAVAIELHRSIFSAQLPLQADLDLLEQFYC